MKEGGNLSLQESSENQGPRHRRDFVSQKFIASVQQPLNC